MLHTLPGAPSPSRSVSRVRHLYALPFILLEVYKNIEMLLLPNILIILPGADRIGFVSYS